MRWARAVAVLLALAAGSPAAAEDPVQLSFDRLAEQANALLLTDPAGAERVASAANQAWAAIRDPGERRDARAKAAWLLAEARLSFNRPDQANAIASLALQTLHDVQPPPPITANLLRTRGFAEAMLGRVEAALADFQHAYAIFGRDRDLRRQALTLQDIGAIYSDAGDYGHMLRYYRESAELGISDAAIQLAAHYNVALALGKMHRYPEAEVEFTRALSAAGTVHNVTYQLRALTELSEAQIRNGRVAEAERTAREAQRLSQSDPSLAGWRPLVLGVVARVELAQGAPAKAEATLRLALRGVDLTRTDLSFRDLHELAVQVFRARGDDALALANLEALKRLDDQSQTLASNTNAALMSARFDFQNQDLKIARLKASELQQAVRLEHARARMHRTVFIVSAVLGTMLLVLMAAALLAMRRSRNRIGVVNDQLSGANAALERALRVKTEFLATTSHEIRTPLNGILGMTQVLLTSRTLEAGLRDRIEVVHSAGQTMRALVDDILDVAKLESGRVELNPGPISLAALFNEAARLWSAEAGRKHLAFETDLGTAPDRIVADEQRLRQILFNLLSNAIKFTERGRIAMRATVTGEADAEMLEIMVEDTGIGIAPGLHEAIFESFRQADSGTTRRFGGTGLGLTICRRLSAAMGGTVTVDSDEGQGARFTLRIPLVRAAALSERTGACAEGPATDLDCSHVLLIERNPLNRGIMTALLSPACGEVVASGSLDEAAELLATRPFDLILADAATLGDNADAVTQAIQTLAGRPVALLVPAAGPALDAQQVGAATIITKPVAGAELIARLCALFGQFGNGAESGAEPGPLRRTAQ